MGAWTTYGKQQIFAIAVCGQAMPTLHVVLYSDSADPATAPTELVLVGYARAEVSFELLSADHGGNDADVAIGPMAVGSYLGVAIADDTGVWFWDDEAAPVAIPAASTVTFLAGTLTPQRV